MPRSTDNHGKETSRSVIDFSILTHGAREHSLELVSEL